MQMATTTIVRVDLNSRGEWQIACPGDDGPVTRKTLEEARLFATSCATRLHPCEVIVYDAYHRVLDREQPLSAAS